MDHSTLNTSAKWKKIFCLIMLVFYFSNISVPLGIPVIDTIRDIMNILLVIVMLTDIAGEAKKFRDNKKYGYPPDTPHFCKQTGQMW